MNANPFQLSLETLIGSSRMLGHHLEDRSRIRHAQDLRIVREIEDHSAVSLWNPAQRHMFCVAPLDVLVTEEHGRKKFHILELNGTGIGGLTNMTEDAVGCVLESMAEMARALPRPDPLILIASSGLEIERAPRRNKLIYEKMLYAEAMKEEFDAQGRHPMITTMAALEEDPDSLHSDRPTIVLGYMKEFLRRLDVTENGRLHLHGRPVTAGVNDRFCLNVVHQFDGRVDLRHFQTMNRCFLPGGDKGVAYELLNEYLSEEDDPNVAGYDGFEKAYTREALIGIVLDWVRSGRRAVIKPQGTGLGHGIEFFLSPTEPEAEIVARIDQSLRETEELYALPGGALPYTVTEFLDASQIRKSGHPHFGRKYELRIVVYRDGSELKAFPSIVKISGEVYDKEKPTRQSLINNITTTAQASGASGSEHMLPLANRETLDLLDLSPELLGDVAAFATDWVRFILDKATDEPRQLGLPEHALVPETAEAPALRAA